MINNKFNFRNQKVVKNYFCKNNFKKKIKLFKLFHYKINN